jgi:HEXXH motif-containing protein
MHVGHLHAVGAAAAIRAGLNFSTFVPMWEGGVALPTLGLARLPFREPHSTARISGNGDRIEITHEDHQVVLTESLDDDTPEWWSVRQVTTTGQRALTVRLDDIDPYRGLREPLTPKRLAPAEVGAWRRLIDAAWRLVADHVPDLADAFSAGLDSIVPSSPVRFRSASASTGEAFGSALIARPDDAPTLAATMVHELQHIVFGGILHLAHLYENDPSERFYVPWRSDPRPLSGSLTGVYAFFGVAAFWRAIARAETGHLLRRAMFEFALARSQSWLVLQALRDDVSLTVAGRRFVDGMASRLTPWQEEPVPEDLCALAAAATTDHHASWLMRHCRPNAHTVTALTEAWLAGQPRPPTIELSDPMPTPVQDGMPSNARADLLRLGIVMGNRRKLASMWRLVRDATAADLAYATGRFADAAQGYRAELVGDPDRVSSWVGLGLALAALRPGPAARALMRRPELVRAVRRQISVRSPAVPPPERLAAWIGQAVH